MSDKYLSESGLSTFADWLKTNYATKTYVDEHLSLQTQGNWRYRVHPDGTFEAWYLATGQEVTITTASGSAYRSDRTSLTLPSGITDLGTATIRSFNVGCGHNNYPTWTAVASLSGATINYYVLSGGSRAKNTNYTVTAYIMGTIS